MIDPSTIRPRIDLMSVLRFIILAGGAGLTGLIIWAMGADDRGLGPVLAEMFREPWSIVTLVDLYLGFFIASAFIFLFERNKLVAVAWALPVFFLGNLWTAVWFAVRLQKIAGRLKRD